MSTDHCSDCVLAEQAIARLYAVLKDCRDQICELKSKSAAAIKRNRSAIDVIEKMLAAIDNYMMHGHTDTAVIDGKHSDGFCRTCADHWAAANEAILLSRRVLKNLVGDE